MDQRSRRDGRFIEQIGWYDPLASDASRQVSVDDARARYWIGVGAQPTPTVRDILARRNVVDVPRWEADRKRERAAMEKRVAAAKAAAPEGEKKAEGSPAAKAEGSAEASS